MRSPPPISDPYSYLGLVKNSDGSFARSPEFHVPTTAASSSESDLCSPPPVLTKDVPINPLNHTWARLYLPRREPSSTADAGKLPLIIFFHGGGFVIGSANLTHFHEFCCTVALRLPALLVSVDYRLAPEHRLPAAYDDGVDALRWARSTADEWLAEHADLSRCYVMGNSAGGNLALHVALRAARIAAELAPVEIRGLVLHQPFFGGVERTPSELRLADDKVLPPFMADVMWGLALPIGADRDHEYSNPAKLLAAEKAVVGKVLVTGYDGDPLIDRMVDLAKVLRERGADVTEDFREGGCHGVEFFDHSYTTTFCSVLGKFILATTAI